MVLWDGELIRMYENDGPSCSLLLCRCRLGESCNRSLQLAPCQVCIIHQPCEISTTISHRFLGSGIKLDPKILSLCRRVCSSQQPPAPAVSSSSVHACSRPACCTTRHQAQHAAASARVVVRSSGAGGCTVWGGFVCWKGSAAGWFCGALFTIELPL